MYLLQTFGCILWLFYGIMINLYPVIFGSIMCLLPSGYIIIVLIFNQNQHQHQVTNESVAIEQINQIRNIIEEIAIEKKFP